jgi:hypothetical protein
MLIQEKISGSETLLKLYVAIDEDLKAPATPNQTAAARSTREHAEFECGRSPDDLVWGAWRRLTDKAKVHSHIQTYHRREFPPLRSTIVSCSHHSRAGGKTALVVGDGGYLSQARAKELAQRGVYLLTATRKNMRYVASQFQVTCRQLRHRVEELFEFMKRAFKPCARRIARHALPIHLLGCFLAYSLYEALIA